jgi:glycerol uptake facilitator-like aquaporin
VTDVRRRATAEAVGTAFLLMAVVGSGIAATRLAPGQPGLQLLVNAVVTGAALLALITVLRPVSAAFNPVVTLVEVVAGEVSRRAGAVLVAAQLAGALIGVVLAHLMFGLDVVALGDQHRAAPEHVLAEVVATAGLVLLVRGAPAAHVAAVVAAYITAAYWFTSSTSFANPAVTLARALTDTFAGIAPASVPAFVVAQVVGGLAAGALASYLFRKDPARA